MAAATFATYILFNICKPTGLNAHVTALCINKIKQYLKYLLVQKWYYPTGNDAYDSKAQFKTTIIRNTYYLADFTVIVDKLESIKTTWQCWPRSINKMIPISSRRQKRLMNILRAREQKSLQNIGTVSTVR